MKKSWKKIVSLLLTASIACGMFAATPVLASAATITKKHVTEYTYRTHEMPFVPAEGYIEVKNATSEPKKVKSSNSKIFHTAMDYDSKKKVARIWFYGDTKGSTNISFKVGSKTYKAKFTVKNYTSPVSTIKISGVNNGKNIASKVKKYIDASVSLPKTTKNAKFTIKPKKGWALTEIEFTGTSKSSSSSKTLINKKYKGATAQKTYKLGTLKKNWEYYVTLRLKNKSNGGSLLVSYAIN